jgi:uncharacterized membrane protein (TIGR02234 family)
MPDARRTFGPVVVAGLATAGLVAAAGVKPWVSAEGTTATSQGIYVGVVSIQDAEREMPLTGALALVVLAAWGVLLVTRGVVRRAVAGLGAIAALGVVACVVVGFATLPDHVKDAFEQGGAGRPDTVFTGWFWAAAIGGVLSVLTTLAAVRYVGAWPEMGTRYDAPGSAEPVESPLEEQSNLDLWKSLDEGHDPTQ